MIISACGDNSIGDGGGTSSVRKLFTKFLQSKSFLFDESPSENSSRICKTVRIYLISNFKSIVCNGKDPQKRKMGSS